ncbi:MAG: hypothetical protein JXR49_15010 [Acidobacteria bacterium]|nr:hypothetical protein [Acidobacteriota bacterium]
MSNPSDMEIVILFDNAADSAILAAKGKTAPIVVDKSDCAGVLRVAGDLQSDFERVADIRPELLSALPNETDTVVILGTFGKSTLIDDLDRFRMVPVFSCAGSAARLDRHHT